MELVRLADSASRSVELPFVIGRGKASDADPLIPSTATKISRSAGQVAEQDGGLFVRATHAAPLGVVRGGLLHQVWQGDASLVLRRGDILVVEGWQLARALGVARGAAPVDAPVGDTDLASFYAFRLESGPGVGAGAGAAGGGEAAAAAAVPQTPFTPAFTQSTPSQDDTPAGAARSDDGEALQETRRLLAALETQLASARAETDRANGEVVLLVVEALVAQVVERGSSAHTADHGTGDDMSVVLAGDDKTDQSTQATVETLDRGTGDGMSVATSDQATQATVETSPPSKNGRAAAPPGPTEGPPRKRQATGKPRTQTAPELVAAACAALLNVAQSHAKQLNAAHLELHERKELCLSDDVPSDRGAAQACKFPSSLPLLLMSRPFLTDCLWLQTHVSSRLRLTDSRRMSLPL